MWRSESLTQRLLTTKVPMYRGYDKDYIYLIDKKAWYVATTEQYKKYDKTSTQIVQNKDGLTLSMFDTHQFCTNPSLIDDNKYLIFFLFIKFGNGWYKMTAEQVLKVINALITHTNTDWICLESDSFNLDRLVKRNFDVPSYATDGVEWSQQKKQMTLNSHPVSILPNTIRDHNPFLTHFGWTWDNCPFKVLSTK